MHYGLDSAYPYTVESSTAGVPVECVNRPGWDGLACVTKPAAQPAGATLPTTTVTDYSQLLAPAKTVQVSGASTRSTTQTYDPVGRPVTTTADGDAAAGTPVAPTTVSYSPTIGLPVSVTRNNKSVLTGYDSWARVTSTTDAGGNKGTVVYNVASAPRVSSDGFADTSYTYDTARAGDLLGEHRGLVTIQEEQLGAGVPATWTAAYGPTGGPSTVTAPNGIVDSRTYSTVGALVGKAYTDHTGAPLMAPWTQTFNVAGQVVAETGPAGTGGSYQSAFTFDNTARLTADVFTASAGGKTSRVYELNKNSDRTGLTVSAPGGGQTRAGTFNAADQLQSSTVTGSGAGSGSYAYDPYGRTTTLPGVDTTSAAAITTSWKINDRVDTETVAGDSGPVTTTVTDDPSDRRSNASVAGPAGEATSYVYGDATDSPAALTVAAAGGSTTRSRFTDSPAGGMSITEKTVAAAGSALPPSWWKLPPAATGTVTSNVEVQLSNPHGDVVATIANTANVPAAQVSTVTVYAPFGTDQTGAIPAATYGWEGTAQRDTNNASNLITMGARLYNQTTGRFLTIDPIPGGNANPYTYPADPINGKDLNGKYDKSAWALYPDAWYLFGKRIPLRHGISRWRGGQNKGWGWRHMRDKHDYNPFISDMIQLAFNLTNARWKRNNVWDFYIDVPDCPDGRKGVFVVSVDLARYRNRPHRKQPRGVLTAYFNTSNPDKYMSYIHNR